MSGKVLYWKTLSHMFSGKRPAVSVRVGTSFWGCKGVRWLEDHRCIRSSLGGKESNLEKWPSSFGTVVPRNETNGHATPRHASQIPKEKNSAGSELQLFHPWQQHPK